MFLSEAIALIEPKLCINHWKVLYKLWVFYVDRNFKMTTTARHSFYIGPIGFFYNQVNDTGSWEPLVICCGGYVVACFRFMSFLEFAQSPDYDFFNIFYDLFLCSFGILLPMSQKKQQTNKPVSGFWPSRGWWAFKLTRYHYFICRTPDIFGVFRVVCSHISSKRILCP